MKRAQLRSLRGPATGLLIATLTLPSAVLPAATGALPPRLVCAEPLFRFGTTSNQTSVVHTFLLRNEGTTTARVSRVAASCGCVVPELDLKEIPPGGQARLLATFSLVGRQGHQRRAIRIMADDAVVPCVELWIEGDIARAPFDPENINFGSVPPTDASARTAHLVGLPAGNRITNAVVDSATFRAAVSEDGHSIVVHAQPPLPEGVLHAMVQAGTDSSNRPVVSVPVTAMVVPLIRVMPSKIEVPRDSRYATRTVWIRPGREGAFTIRDVRCTADGVTPLLTSIGAGIYRLDLKNIPVSDALEGKEVVLTTSFADLPGITIPFVLSTAPSLSGTNRINR